MNKTKKEVQDQVTEIQREQTTRAKGVQKRGTANQVSVFEQYFYAQGE